MDTITLSYRTSVYVAAGWRSVDILAEARPCGRGLAEVVDVLDVDGNSPDCRRASRTGANRQRYNPSSIVAREIGKRKRISACQIVS